MKFRSIFPCLALFAAMIILAACPTEQKIEFGELSILISGDSFTVEPGGTVSIPYTVSGLKDETGTSTATVTVEAESSSPDCTVKVDGTSESEGTVDFTAPAVVPTETEVTVTVRATDEANNRSDSKSVKVSVTKSEDLKVAFKSVPKSVLMHTGSSFKAYFTVSGIGAAKVSVKAVADDEFTASAEMTSETDGTATFTLNGTVPQSVGVKVEVTDDFDREASCEADVSVMESSQADADVANCYIVSPGSTFTFKSVKGNSTEAALFDSVDLLWQDQTGMVKSVAGNSEDGIIAVALNAGISGNAVIEALKDSVVVWSWHLWVTDYDPEAAPLVWTTDEGKTYTILDRNLGAMNNTVDDQGAFGLYYQWGRKDPFVGPLGVESLKLVKRYDIDGNIIPEKECQRPETTGSENNVQLAIENPGVFYFDSDTSLPRDWCASRADGQDDDLWGKDSGVKTIYDPCPAGYMVAEPSAFGFRKKYAYVDESKSAYDDNADYFWHDNRHTYDGEAGSDRGFVYQVGGWTSSNHRYWFPCSGNRMVDSGELYGVGGSGDIWTNNVQSSYAVMEIFAYGNPASYTGLNRPYGASIRCQKIEK